MAQIYGDLNVTRLLTTYRVNSGATEKTITAQESLAKYCAQSQLLSAASAQDVVLPDATTLPVGWEVNIYASGAATLTVKSYHATTPVTVQAVSSGEYFGFKLIDNADSAGTWHAVKYHGTDSTPSSRYIGTFDATTSWGTASGGYYTMTITGATHERGVSPSVSLYETSGSDFILVNADEIKVNGSSGDISIRVVETPDGRFAGKVVAI